MSRRLDAALYYARKRRRGREDAMPPSTVGRVKFGGFNLYIGNEPILSGTEEDVQLSEALALMTGDITIGGDSVTISGDAVVEGNTDLQQSVKAANLKTADDAAGVLWQDNAAARVVKVSA